MYHTYNTFEEGRHQKGMRERLDQMSDMRKTRNRTWHSQKRKEKTRRGFSIGEKKRNSLLASKCCIVQDAEQCLLSQLLSVVNLLTILPWYMIYCIIANVVVCITSHHIHTYIHYYNAAYYLYIRSYTSYFTSHHIQYIWIEMNNIEYCISVMQLQSNCKEAIIDGFQ